MGSNSPRKGHCGMKSSLFGHKSLEWVSWKTAPQYQYKKSKVWHIFQPSRKGPLSEECPSIQGNSLQGFQAGKGKATRLGCPDRQFWFMKSQYTCEFSVDFNLLWKARFQCIAKSFLFGWMGLLAAAVSGECTISRLAAFTRFEGEWEAGTNIVRNNRTLAANVFSRPRSLISPFYHTL